MKYKLGLAVLLLLSPVVVQAAGPAQVLSVYDTSSSKNSAPLMKLLDGSGQGSWSPESKDFGTNEGVYIQFADPVKADYVEIEFTGSFDNRALSINGFINGKNSKADGSKAYETQKKDKGNASGPVVIQLGQSTDKGETIGPLTTKIASFFFRITYQAHVGSPGTPVVKAIRFLGTNGPIALKLPQIVPVEIQASSVLEPFTAYQPANLFDSRADFAWSTDGKKTTGVGETLELTLGQPIDLDGLMVWNGYQRSEEHFSSNGRVSQLEVSADGGAPQTLKLKDKMEAQQVSLTTPLYHVRKLNLKILGITPGSNYKDVLISELRLMAPHHNLILPQATLAVPKVSGSYQEDLDKTWTSALEDASGGSRYRNMLRIRSNGTFVHYASPQSCGWDCPDQNITDGNWEFRESVFHLFGKKYTSSYSDSPYSQGGEGKGSYGIFNTDLHLTLYSSMSSQKRLQVLQAIMGSTRMVMVVPASGSKAFNWIMEDDPKGTVSAATEKELLDKVDKHLMKTKAIFVETEDLYDILLPNDELFLDQVTY